jgi:hypothetical protein
LQVTDDNCAHEDAFGDREREGVVVLQLRRNGKKSSARFDERGSNREDRTLTQLVMAAADVARDKPAIIGQGYAVKFGELKARAQGAAIAMASEAGVDDSALTVALMTSVPGLAVSGPKGLADTLAGIRIQAMMVLAEAELV